MKSTCCDRKKPTGVFKILPLAFLGAIGTLIAALSIEIGIVYIFSLI
jgi:hypothetical protein|tara:strand:+ start:417 stop:557 length:141 start_codon:yes stop_codon:yes gene_type:complete